MRQSQHPQNPPGHDHSLRRRLVIKLAAWMRWLHIYLSMFGLAAVLFFSATGITLNHPDWFYGEAGRDVRSEGQLDAKWLRGNASDPEGVSKLEVVEHLRSAHRIRGALAEFRVDESECVVTFKGPGYAADTFIDRGSGRYTLNQTFHGLVAILNDLHKGRDTGPVWSLALDISAVALVVISLSGLILLFYLKRRRLAGLFVVVLGTMALAAVVLLGVP